MVDTGETGLSSSTIPAKLTGSPPRERVADEVSGPGLATRAWRLVARKAFNQVHPDAD